MTIHTDQCITHRVHIRTCYCDIHLIWVQETYIYLTLGFTRPHEVLCGHEVQGGDSKCHTDKCSIG